MMNLILKEICIELMRRVELAKISIERKEYPKEVQSCFEWVIQVLTSYEIELKKIQTNILQGLQDDEYEQALYDELVGMNRAIEVIDDYYVHPLFRLSADDNLSLKLIYWLHQLHPQTFDKPFVLSNGNFSIMPADSSPTLYFLPVTSQLSLLYLPLFYHEFGHQLFLSHQAELEALIAEFQSALADRLSLMVSQNDTQDEMYQKRASDIIETWREWMEELFCDAVGLTIGGESYLICFSHFLRVGGIQEFFVPESSLSRRSHPVTYLRIKFLVDRASTMGLSLRAEEIIGEWDNMAGALKVREDYFGYYDETYKHLIDQLLDDMITEANPVEFNSIDTDTEGGALHQLVQSAWNQFLNDSGGFNEWEKAEINKIGLIPNL